MKKYRRVGGILIEVDYDSQTANSRIKKEDKPGITADRKAGMSYYQIGSKYGYSFATIRNFCIDNKVKQEAKMPKQERIGYWIKERKDKLAEMWNAGEDIITIGAYFDGRSITAIQSKLQAMKREGYEVKSRARAIRYAQKGGIVRRDNK